MSWGELNGEGDPEIQARLADEFARAFIVPNIGQVLDEFASRDAELVSAEARDYFHAAALINLVSGEPSRQFAALEYWRWHAERFPDVVYAEEITMIAAQQGMEGRMEIADSLFWTASLHFIGDDTFQIVPEQILQVANLTSHLEAMKMQHAPTVQKNTLLSLGDQILEAASRIHDGRLSDNADDDHTDYAYMVDNLVLLFAIETRRSDPELSEQAQGLLSMPAGKSAFDIHIQDERLADLLLTGDFDQAQSLLTDTTLPCGALWAEARAKIDPMDVESELLMNMIVDQVVAARPDLFDDVLDVDMYRANDSAIVLGFLGRFDVIDLYLGAGSPEIASARAAQLTAYGLGLRANSLGIARLTRSLTDYSPDTIEMVKYGYDLGVFEHDRMLDQSV